MAIKVGKIDNLFWSNGSWEKPSALPDITDFTSFDELLPDWLDAKRTGTIILTGEDWNYCYCENAYYFLQRAQLLDRDTNTYLYTLIKDWWVNWIEQGVTIKGYCTRTNNEALILKNLDYVEPTIENPCDIKRLNLRSDLQKDWYQNLDLRKPLKTREQFLIAAVTEADWFNFIEDIMASPPLTTDYSTNEKQYQRGVWIIGELEVRTKTARWKQEVYDKLQWLLDNKEKYVLTKVNKLGDSIAFKNKYALTLKTEAIGSLEETAKVEKLDFSNLFDIVVDEKFRDSEDISAPFEQQQLKREELARKYTVSEDDSQRHKEIKILQRKVYFPYPRVSWATNKNYLFRGYLEETLISSGRSQETSLSNYTELESFIPIYQGCYAQGVLSKSKPQGKFWLAYSNQLNITFNYHIENDTINQGAGWLDGKIPYFSELNPPEFGFLIFNFFKERKDWNWFHYKGKNALLAFPVLVGLRKGWDEATLSSYDRVTGNWVKEVSKWFNNFSLLNSLYPVAWLYYFSALKDNKVVLRKSEWGDWATDSGFFGYGKQFEQIIDFSSPNTISLINRNIDNKLLDLQYIDKVRKDFISKQCFINYETASIPIQKDDIFFSDLQAFWEELPEHPRNFKYRPELSWYLDVNKDHLANKKNYKSIPEAPKLVCYFDGSLQKFCLGIYHTHLREHRLREEEHQDIEQVQFRETNAGTTLETLPVTEGRKAKEVIYHHIKPIDKPVKENKIDFSEKASFIQWAKGAGLEHLRQIDQTLKEINLDIEWVTRGFGWHIWGGRTFLISDAIELKYLDGKNHLILKELPKLPDGTYEWEAVYDILKSSGATYEEDDNVFYHRSDSGLPSWRGYVAKYFEYSGALTAAALKDWDYFRTGATYEQSDIIKFNSGKARYYLVSQSIRYLIPLLVQQIKYALDSKHKLPISNKYTFNSPNSVIQNLNTENLQKAIYQGLGLLTEGKLIVPEDINITNKLFELRGTNYWLYIDLNKIPHLIFKDIAINSDINLHERKTFSVIESETPSQDLIDLINQKNSIQIITAQYPLQERLVFSGLPRHFNIAIDRYSVEGKTNPSDYLIVQYKGARQLIDVKLAVPKRRTAEGADRDLLEIEKLNLDREKWREDFRERNIYFQAQKKRELEEIKFSKDRLHYETAFKWGQQIWGLTKFGAGAAGLFAGHYVSKHTEQIDDKMQYVRPTGQTIGGRFFEHLGSNKTFWGKFAQKQSGMALTSSFQRASNAYHSLGLLSVQKEDLASQIEATIAELQFKNYELQREHHYQEREFALRLSSLANVYEQGEVTDRDINDLYNRQFGLNEVHLIYRTPSSIQREAIDRYYKLYGVDCQIPDVEFKISKALKVGDIWKFDYISEITNLFKFEEKELLRGILFNGIKIIELKKAAPILLPERALSWEQKVEQLLAGATDEERKQLFNNLKTKVNQIELIEELAEQLPNKDETLIKLIAPLIPKDKLTVAVIKSGTVQEKEDLVLNIIDTIDHKKVFEHLLAKEDKEKIIENWAEENPRLANVLWDKFSNITLSRKEHEEEISIKDSQLAARESLIRKTNKELAELIESTQELNKAFESRGQQLISLNREKASFNSETRKLRDRIQSKEAEISSLTLEKEKVDSRVKSLTEEKNQLTLQYDSLNTEKQRIEGELSREQGKISALEQEVATLKAKPSAPPNSYSNVDYLITKKDDKAVVTAWNKEKNIWVEQPQLVVKRRDETKLLRIAYEDEKFVTDQYPFWSWYTNEHHSKFNIKVSTFNILEGYVTDTQLKKAHSWVGRYSVEVDKNIPYLDSNGNWVKPYWYHPIKGWFDYEMEGARKINSYEEYQELTKNAVTDLQKELEEKENTIKALRELEHAPKAEISFSYPSRLSNILPFFLEGVSISYLGDNLITPFCLVVKEGINYRVLVWNARKSCLQNAFTGEHGQPKSNTGVYYYQGYSLWYVDIRMSENPKKGYYIYPNYKSSFYQATQWQHIQSHILNHGSQGQATNMNNYPVNIITELNWPWFHKDKDNVDYMPDSKKPFNEIYFNNNLRAFSAKKTNETDIKVENYKIYKECLKKLFIVS